MVYAGTNTDRWRDQTDPDHTAVEIYPSKVLGLGNYKGDYTQVPRGGEGERDSDITLAADMPVNLGVFY